MDADWIGGSSKALGLMHMMVGFMIYDRGRVVRQGREGGCREGGGRRGDAKVIRKGVVEGDGGRWDYG